MEEVYLDDAVNENKLLRLVNVRASLGWFAEPGGDRARKTGQYAALGSRPIFPINLRSESLHALAARRQRQNVIDN